MPVSRCLIWAAVYASLVAGDGAGPRESRVFLNFSATVSSTSTMSSTSDVTTSLKGGPSHGQTRPTTLMSTTPVVMVIGGHTVTDGSYVNNMGDTITVTTSFIQSPVGVSAGVPTATELSLPWAGSVLTNPKLRSSTGVSSSLASGSFPISEGPLSIVWIISSPSPSKWSNTTWSSTTSIGESTNSSSIRISTSTLDLAQTASLPVPGGNVSYTSFASASATYSLFKNVSTCSSLAPGEPVTIWSILPNTTTTTMTITGNQSISLTRRPEFTPRAYCPTSISNLVNSTAVAGGGSSAGWMTTTRPLLYDPPRPTTVTLTDSAGISSTVVYTSWRFPATLSLGRLTVTSITTSKNGITEITSVTLPSYGGNGKTDKISVDPTSVPPDSFSWLPQTEPPRPGVTSASETPSQSDRPSPSEGPATWILVGDPSATTPITEVVGGVTVVAAPGKAVIGGQTVDIGPAPQTVTESGEVFTVLPKEIDGPNVVISVPTDTSGGVFIESPTPTTVDGVSIEIAGSTVVIGGTSYNIGPGAPEQTIVAKGQTISLGSAGVIFDSTTITAPPNPPAATPTNIAVVGGQVITAVGSSMAVIGGQTITYGPNTPQITTVLNGESITIGPPGVFFRCSTIGGTKLNPSNTQIGIVGGVSITEIGSSVAIISGTTFTIGPGATPTTAIISSHTVSAGPDGLSDGSFTWNPFPSATRTLTAAGVTFSEIGSSLVVIGSKTFTFGPGAKPTTDVYGGQTISIGPSGVGFSTTTFVPSSRSGTSTGTAATAKTTSKKNTASGLRPVFGVWGICIIVCIGWIL